MKKIIYILLIISISLLGNIKHGKFIDIATEKEEVDIVTSATTGRNCGGKYCLNIQTCVESVCEYNCSREYPEGVCEDNYSGCMNGNCTDICSVENPNGFCLYGNICKEGVCEDNNCSDLITDGYCPIGDICDNGVCKDNNCSDTNEDGYCQYGTFCIDGICDIKKDEGCAYNNSSTPWIPFIGVFIFFIFYKREQN